MPLVNDEVGAGSINGPDTDFNTIEARFHNNIAGVILHLRDGILTPNALISDELTRNMFDFDGSGQGLAAAFFAPSLGLNIRNLHAIRVGEQAFEWAVTQCSLARQV